MNQASQDRKPEEPHRVRLPGFVSDRQIGLGDVLQQATYVLRIKPCDSCARRAAALNRWIVFGR